MTSQHNTGTHPFYIGMYIHICTHIYVHIYTSQKECLCIFHMYIYIIYINISVYINIYYYISMYLYIHILPLWFGAYKSVILRPALQGANKFFTLAMRPVQPLTWAKLVMAAVDSEDSTFDSLQNRVKASLHFATFDSEPKTHSRFPFSVKNSLIIANIEK